MRFIQAALVVGAVSALSGCIIRRGELTTNADAPDDAFVPPSDDAPDDVWAPDVGVPIDVYSPPDACMPSCVDDKFDNCMGDPQSCLLGCVTSGPPACKEMVFSNVDSPEVNALVRDATESLNVGDARVIGDCATSVMTTLGQRVCLYIYSDIRITGSLTFNGTLPVILIGRDFIHVTETGVIHAEARRDTPGPGGAGPGSGALRGSDGNNSTFDDGGGGGGGSCGAGGNGGRGGGSSGGAGGGAMVSMLEPLVGGSGGGSGPGSGGGAGAGGGALQLSSLREIVFGGSVYLGGGAGERGRQDGTNYGAGGGGGGGGGLLLEAPIMNLTGATLVTTGGGGGGSSGLTGSGSDGLDGTSFTGGGGGSGGLSASGGAGSIEGAGINGSSNTDGLGNGGGGGGGVGSLVIRQVSLVPAAYTSPSLAPCFQSLALRSR